MKKSLLLLPFGVALAQPVIEPNFADRLFPYVTYGEVWSGTPAMLKDVAIPNVLVV